MNRWIFKTCISLILLFVVTVGVTLVPISNRAFAIPQDVAESVNSSNYWTPKVNTSWHWQLDGVDTSVNADVYDIDLFDNTEQVVEKLHRAGRHVICYINVGAWEEWRDDADDFPEEVLGNVYSEEYPDEKWLDIRSDVVRQIMEKRLQECKRRGFDAVEPDNIDSYDPEGKAGFPVPITKEDQIKYDAWLIEKAHSLGLSIGMKNDQDSVESTTENGDQLVDLFDWALTEDCFTPSEKWCEKMEPFIRKGKAVLSAEYKDKWEVDEFTNQVCPKAKQLKFSTLLLERDLNTKPLATCS
ncbi:MAG: endo alpha-1,4 polygalactosaminidase [Cyanobacteriota bacterium]